MIISNEKLIRFDRAAIDSSKIGDDEFSFLTYCYLLLIIVTSMIVRANLLINNLQGKLEYIDTRDECVIYTLQVLNSNKSL